MAESSSRLTSLDQFRGYTVVGMLFVNFLDHYETIKPTVFNHHRTYCSYADSIMPCFLFAVGFAFRLTLLKSLRETGSLPWGRIARRIIGLILFATLYYGLSRRPESWAQLNTWVKTEGWLAYVLSNFYREPFETLMHIGVTSLWVLPVITGTVWARVNWIILSLAAHSILSLQFGYFDFAMNRPVIDGGPLGFLTWTVPLLAGSFAYDIVASGKRVFRRLVGLAIAFMAAGYALSCPTVNYAPPEAPPPEGTIIGRYVAEPPFFPPMVRVDWSDPSSISRALFRIPGVVKAKGGSEVVVPQRKANYYMMTQRGGTPSYLIFGAGFSLFVYAFFHLACDRGGWRSSLLLPFGRNALAAYILHGIVGETLEKVMPFDCPLWAALGIFVVFLFFNWLFLRSLEKSGVYLRI